MRSGHCGNPVFSLNRIVLLLLVLFAVTDLFAECQCPPLDAQEQLEQSISAFSAKVYDVKKNKKTGIKTITFDVKEVFKGTPEPYVSLTDAEAGKDCAINFKEGESYMVYVRWEWGTTHTSRCFGTKPLEKAADEAATLGPNDIYKEKLYDYFQKACMGKRDTPCCLSSVKIMRANYYLPEPENGCPAGTIPDRLKCGGSLRWCVPNEDAGHRRSK